MLFVVRSRRQCAGGKAKNTVAAPKPASRHATASGNWLRQRVRNSGEPPLGLRQAWRPEHRTDFPCEPGPQAPGHLGQHIPLEVDHAALPSGLRQPMAHGRGEPGVLVRNHELDPAQAALRELAQEVAPAGLGLLDPERHA